MSRLIEAEKADRFALSAFIFSTLFFLALFLALWIKTGPLQRSTVILFGILFLAHFFVLYAVLWRMRVHLKKTREKAEQALSDRLERRWQSADHEKNRIFAILESMTEGVMVVDTKQTALLLNGALARTLGVARDAVEGRFFWESIRDPDINEMIQTCLYKKSPQKKEHALLLSNAVLDIQVTPVFSGTEFLGAIAVFRDVTQVKELERLRSEFVANVSHELKTPLTSILGFIETLKEGAADDSENRAHFLQIIEEHSKKLHRLIEDLLLLSKVESAKGPARKEVLDLAKLMNRLEEMFERPMQKKGLKLQKEFSHAPFMIFAEPDSFERALANLLDNAVKYNVRNGRIAVRASDDGSLVRIEVEDSGIGILPPDQARIFERFYRADKSRSRESGGSGLGLSIAKHILERHGGRIEVDSIPEKGSTFTLFLPKS